MNPNNSSLNTDQQTRLNTVMNTSVTSIGGSPGANQAMAPNSAVNEPLHTTAGTIAPSSPLGATPQSVYQVPTVGGSPSPSLGGPTPAMPQPGSAAHTPAAKPVKAGGGFSLMPVLYVIGGLVFLVVYTVVWAVVFDLTLPFGITLPF